MSTAFERKYWPCGCREVHHVGTCVHYLTPCAGTACERIPPPEPLELTGDD